jgi:DNA polymerase alpha subunit A
MKRFQVASFKSKACKRKYAFELPDIPKEAEYLKVLYPYEGEICDSI